MSFSTFDMPINGTTPSVSKTHHPVNPTLAVWGIASQRKSVPKVRHLAHKNLNIWKSKLKAQKQITTVAPLQFAFKKPLNEKLTATVQRQSAIYWYWEYCTVAVNFQPQKIRVFSRNFNRILTVFSLFFDVFLLFFFQFGDFHMWHTNKCVEDTPS